MLHDATALVAVARGPYVVEPTRLRPSIASSITLVGIADYVRTALLLGVGLAIGFGIHIWVHL